MFSLLLFIVVVEALSKGLVAEGCLGSCLCADDLVLLANSEGGFKEEAAGVEEWIGARVGGECGEDGGRGVWSWSPEGG